MYGQKEVCGHVEGVCGGVKEGWYGCVMWVWLHGGKCLTGCMGDFVLFPSVSCVKWPPPTLLG